MKISVVVPVYNPGTFLTPCVESLLDQSLPSEDYEVILVDDGSDDPDTLEALRRAGRQRGVQVIRIPNSGWPGRPRNIGTDAAVGEYVYYVDHDDHLDREALERVYDYGRANDADIVIGRIEGHGRRVPRTLFRQDRPACSLETAPLMESMTPHKAFRREFLLAHDLRFPEGPRRLEDHHFVVRAYLLARVVSVLSSHTCYHHTARPDAGNAGFRTLEPQGYYSNLREAVEQALALTEPGPRRTIVLRRWLRVEMLNRLGGAGFARADADRQRGLTTAVGALARDHFTDPGVAVGLNAVQQARLALLLDDDVAGLAALARWEVGWKPAVEVTELHWTEEGRLSMDLRVTLRDADSQPVVAGAAESGACLQPPPPLPSARVPMAEVAEDGPGLTVFLRHRDTKSERWLTASARPVGESLHGHVDIEVASKDPLTQGVWDVYLQFRWPNLGASNLRRRVGAVRAPEVSCPEPWPAGAEHPDVVPYWTDQGNFSLDVGGTRAGV